MKTNKQKSKIYLLPAFLICFLFLISTSAEAQELICADPASKESYCAETAECEAEGGIICDNTTYCDGSCNPIMGSHCCCVFGENQAEIPIGRLIDETEYLADEIIKQAEIIIEQALREINAATALGDNVHVKYPENPDEPGCRKQNCTAQCDQETTCVGCDCGGCPSGWINVESEADGCKVEEGVEECGEQGKTPCCELNSTSALPFNKIYGVLQSKNLAYIPCVPPEEPSEPTDLSAKTSYTYFVHLDWELEKTGCEEDEKCNIISHQCFGECDLSLDICYIKPRYQIIYYQKGLEDIVKYRSKWVWGAGSETDLALPYLPEAGETHYWAWQVRVHNGLHDNYSGESEFKMIGPDDPDENGGETPEPPASISVVEGYASCSVVATWTPGGFNHSTECSDSSYKLQYKKTKETAWQTIRTDDLTATVGPTANINDDYDWITGNYDWQVSQGNGCEWSEPVKTFFEFRNRPKKPEVTADPEIDEYLLSASFKWQKGDVRCGDCNCDECNDVTYRVWIRNTLYGNFEFSDWLSGTNFTKTGLQRGIRYEAWVVQKNGCDVESEWAGLGSFIIACDCECNNVCSPDTTIAKDQDCGLYEGGICVKKGTCAFDIFNPFAFPILGGTLGLPQECGNRCSEEQECCTGLRTGCMPDTASCLILGGTPCVGAVGSACDDISACFGRCNQIGAICCTAIPANQTCAEKICPKQTTPFCCCQSIYNYCLPDGCVGSPCPYPAIESEFATIENALRAIESARDIIILVNEKMQNDIPPQLGSAENPEPGTIREKLASCFMQAGAEEAVARGEQDIIYLTDCQNALEAGEMYSHMPLGKESQAKEGLEGLLEILGKSKVNIQRGCYGNTYRKNFEARVASGEMTKERAIELTPPYPAPWAEDLFCCFWE